LPWNSIEQISKDWFSNLMAKEESPKPARLILRWGIICFVGVCFLPFLHGCAISVPGFAYTPSLSGQVVDKNGKPLPDTYILYDYQGKKQGIVSSSSYVLGGAIIVTDKKGQFTIPSLAHHKSLFSSRARIRIYAGYSPVTHSHFYAVTDQHGKVTLPDNTSDLIAWADSLNRVEFVYRAMQMVDFENRDALKNQEAFTAMLQSEHRLLTARKN
jgi:hypothetical protein